MIDYSRRKHSVIVKHKYGETRIRMIEYPGPEDWAAVYRRALITEGKTPKDPYKEPSSEWKAAILDARHSPIRRAMYSFEFEDIPSNTSVHFCRHVHAQPYVSSLRTDRIAPEYMEKLKQDLGEFIDSDHAPRMTPVGMILDMNAEEAQEMANKRLCIKAAHITRMIMRGMKKLMIQVTPEIERGLVPRCEYCGGRCHEIKSCNRYPHF